MNIGEELLIILAYAYHIVVLADTCTVNLLSTLHVRFTEKEIIDFLKKIIYISNMNLLCVKSKIQAFGTDVVN